MLLAGSSAGLTVSEWPYSWFRVLVDVAEKPSIVTVATLQSLKTFPHVLSLRVLVPLVKLWLEGFMDI